VLPIPIFMGHQSFGAGKCLPPALSKSAICGISIRNLRHSKSALRGAVTADLRFRYHAPASVPLSSTDIQFRYHART